MRFPIRDQRALRVFLCAAFLFALSWSLHRAWTHTESDFPSYYTAAHLLLKREPLHRFYDMAWFQEQMDSIVVPNLLGGYIPQTPITMLPFIPLASLPMNGAKQLWLIADIALLRRNGFPADTPNTARDFRSTRPFPFRVWLSVYQPDAGSILRLHFVSIDLLLLFVTKGSRLRRRSSPGADLQPQTHHGAFPGLLRLAEATEGAGRDVHCTGP